MNEYSNIVGDVTGKQVGSTFPPWSKQVGNGILPRSRRPTPRNGSSCSCGGLVLHLFLNEYNIDCDRRRFLYQQRVVTDHNRARKMFAQRRETRKSLVSRFN